MDMETKKKLATVVIDNSGSEDALKRNITDFVKSQKESRITTLLAYAMYIVPCCVLYIILKAYRIYLYLYSLLFSSNKASL